jgi:hypothetical protein
MLRQAQQSTHPLFRNFGTLRGGETVSAEHIVTCFLFLVNLFELHSPASPLERGLRGVSLRIFIDTIAQSDAIDCNKKAPHCGAFLFVFNHATNIVALIITYVLLLLVLILYGVAN